MANIITSSRILCSILLLFFSPLSPVFYILYIICVFTDMIDGTVARMTNSVSELGSKLDTIADFTFILACLIKVLPILEIPVWLLIWIFAIAAIKVSNVVIGFVLHKKLMVEHTVLNKVTGVLLFLIPLTLSFAEFKYSGAAVGVLATTAAIQEGYFIIKGK